jgi:hypothetical protein
MERWRATSASRLARSWRLTVGLILAADCQLISSVDVTTKMCTTISRGPRSQISPDDGGRSSNRNAFSLIPATVVMRDPLYQPFTCPGGVRSPKQNRRKQARVFQPHATRGKKPLIRIVLQESWLRRPVKKMTASATHAKSN